MNLSGCFDVLGDTRWSCRHIRQHETISENGGMIIWSKPTLLDPFGSFQSCPRKAHGRFGLRNQKLGDAFQASAEQLAFAGYARGGRRATPEAFRSCGHKMAPLQKQNAEGTQLGDPTREFPRGGLLRSRLICRDGAELKNIQVCMSMLWHGDL